MLMAHFTGKPTTPWGRRNAAQTRRMLEAAGVPAYAIESGAFDHIDPQTAAMWRMGYEESQKRFGQTESSFKDAVRLLATQLGGDIPQDMIDKYELEPGTVQSKVDRLQQDIIDRRGLEREGYISGEEDRIKQMAARQGQPVSGRDMANVATRGATIYGRQTGADISRLQQSDLGRRERIISRIAALSGTRQYEPTDYSALSQYPRQVGGTIGSLRQRQGQPRRRSLLGAQMVRRRRKPSTAAPSTGTYPGAGWTP